jgi:uncharacterized protein YjlB
MAVKKIEMRPKGDGSYGDILYPKTSADQVVTDTTRQFVSATEKNTWNGKADGNHNHSGTYEPVLNANQKRAIHVGTTDPDASLGNDGDLYVKYK